MAIRFQIINYHGINIINNVRMIHNNYVLPTANNLKTKLFLPLIPTKVLSFPQIIFAISRNFFPNNLIIQ